MRQPLRTIGVILLAAGMTACINVSTVIKVNPDGSGFIEETVLISRIVLEQLSGMIQGMAEGLGTPDPGALELPGIFDESQLQAKASQFGQGVQYVSGEAITSETGDGYHAVYYFPDINLLQIDQTSSDKMGNSPLSSLGSLPKQFLTFQFQRGEPNTLTVRLPRGSQDQESNKPETADEGSLSFGQAGVPELNPQMLAMFQSFFEDMKIAISLEIEGSITGTNATHLDGSEITIMELDSGELFADPGSLAQLQSTEIKSLEDAQWLLQDLPGIKVDLNDELMVQFR